MENSDLTKMKNLLNLKNIKFEIKGAATYTACYHNTKRIITSEFEIKYLYEKAWMINTKKEMYIEIDSHNDAILEIEKI